MSPLTPTELIAWVDECVFEMEWGLQQPEFGPKPYQDATLWKWDMSCEDMTEYTREKNRGRGQLSSLLHT